jgi:RsiW-degrading membrane proteinase PrsW (M82 family)
MRSNIFLPTTILNRLLDHSTMDIFLLSLIAAITHPALRGGIIYWVDRYEREPLWLLSAAFLWGAIPSIIMALIFNEVLSIPLYLLAGPYTWGYS